MRRPRAGSRVPGIVSARRRIGVGQSARSLERNRVIDVVSVKIGSSQKPAIKRDRRRVLYSRSTRARFRSTTRQYHFRPVLLLTVQTGVIFVWLVAVKNTLASPRRISPASPRALSPSLRALLSPSSHFNHFKNVAKMKNDTMENSERISSGPHAGGKIGMYNGNSDPTTNPSDNAAKAGRREGNDLIGQSRVMTWRAHRAAAIE